MNFQRFVGTLGFVVGMIVGIVPSPAFAQRALLDSLLHVWKMVESTPNDSAKIMLMNDLSEKYRLYTNDVEQARYYAFAALKAARVIKFGRGEGDALHRLSLAYFVQSHYDTARIYSVLALAVRTSIKDTIGMGRSLNASGLTYQFQGVYGKASELYFQALQLQESVGDSLGMAVSCDNIGTCYRFQANFIRAIEFHQRALSINKAIGNDANVPYSLMGLGAVYEAINNFAKALEYYTGALHQRQRLNHQQGVAISLGALGKLYYKMGRTNEALQTQMRALALQDSIKDRSGMALSLTEVGRLYTAQKNWSAALQYCQKALALAEEIGSQMIMGEATALCAEILRQQGKHEEALTYFMRSAAIKDSIFSQKTAQQLADMATQREIDKKEQDLALLAKDNDIKTSWRNGLIAVLVLVSALTLVITMRYYDNKRANAEIVRQQQILSEQAREIELINTEIQQANDELEQKNAALVQLNEEKNEFLGIAAHDMKSPLSSIRLLSGVIYDQYPSIEALQARDSALLIRQLADQMFGLIKNLLDANAIEQGMMNLSSDVVDMNLILRVVLDHYKSLAEEKGIVFELYQDSSLFAKADALAAEQVLENIISNAVKFSPLGGIVQIRLSQGRVYHHNHTETDYKGYICLSVRDSGVGILDHDKPKLFGKFARLSARPTGNEHSTGLGLSIVKKMVDAMQGQVWCESNASNGVLGTTFIVLLPTIILAES